MSEARDGLRTAVAASLLALAVASPVASPVAADAAATGEPPPCQEAVDQGLIEERRARFPAALALLDQARRDPACVAAAEVALAKTYNSMNEHKKAIAAARRVLAESADPELLAAAHYEIGRALDRPGRRLTKQKAQAAEAFAAAIEVSGGEHRGAVRALMRIYRQTRQEEQLAALEERHPDIRVKTFAEQKRAVAPKRPAPGATTARPPRVCLTGEVAKFDPQLPRFWDPGNAADKGYSEPVRVEGQDPEYPEEEREAGIEGKVRFALRVGAGGEVVAVAVLEGLAPGLDEATEKAACLWRYRPATGPDGGVTDSYVMVELELRID